MTEAQFEATVQRLETFAQENPSGYRTRVLALAILGYFFLGFISFGTLGLFGILILVILATNPTLLLSYKAWIPLGILLGFLLRGFWFRAPRPEGRPLTREMAPRLFFLLDSATRRMATQPIHQVLIDDSFNAGIAQIPSFGLFGKNQNYLLIGLPFINAMSAEHFQAVLAHEFGHISGNHGGFGAWVYRLRRTWGRLQVEIDRQKRFGLWPVRAFLDWYAPLFMAYTFVLARAQEYEADKLAAETIGAQITAEALIETEVKHDFYEDIYWRETLGKAKNQPRPVMNIYSGMNPAYRAWVTPERISLRLRAALRAETGYADTHPALADRLKSLGYLAPDAATDGDEPPVAYRPADNAMTAAQWLFGAALDNFYREFDQDWTVIFSERWQERYEMSQEAREFAHTLSRTPLEKLSNKELWVLTLLMLEYFEDSDPEPFLRLVLERDPDHARANFNLGLALLEREDPEGVTFLEKVMREDIEGTFICCEVLFQYFKERNDDERAETYRTYARRHQDKLQLAESERETMTEKDRLAPHGLEEAILRPLRRQFARVPNLRSVHIARKQVRHLPNYPVYIVGIEGDFPWYTLNTASAAHRLLMIVENAVDFPFRVQVYLLNRRTKWLRTKFDQVYASHVYLWSHD
jgi:Zn-dependent protease with chaperone function